MSYPYKFTSVANKHDLVEAFGGKKVADLPTPSFVVDKQLFKQNCERMLSNVSRLNADFRAHVKTHKTIEGTRLQLGSGNFKTDKIVVSTLIEAWGLLPLVKEGLIKDILFSLPVVKSRLEELAELSKYVPHLRLMLDNEEQLDILCEFSKTHKLTQKWSIFIKINMGTNRAGFEQQDCAFDKTLKKLLTTPCREHISLYGLYCHAGHSYGSSSEDQAEGYLLDEIANANAAGKRALEIDPSLKLQLSVGATPTAHASKGLDISSVGKLHGQLELHAGNYPFCDLQQLSTKCIEADQISCRVLAEVISCYPNRGSNPGEQLINAGAIALAREFGPIPGHGRVTSPKGYGNWFVQRLSQEHGILAPAGEGCNELMPLGTKVQIIPQHSCITAAAYPWFFVVDGSDTVVDIWVPWRGW